MCSAMCQVPESIISCVPHNNSLRAVLMTEGETEADGGKDIYLWSQRE